MALFLIAETTLVSVDETKQPHVDVEIAQEPAAQEEDCATPFATHGQGVTETPETVDTVELQNTTTDDGDMPITETSDQKTGPDIDPTPQMQSCPESSNKNSPQTRKGRLSKVKPKPNLGQALRSAHSKSQPETSTVKTSVDAFGLSQATETQETPKMENDSPNLPVDEISCIEVKLIEGPSGSQEMSLDVVKSGEAASDQSASENQSHCSSGTLFEPSLEQATGDATKTSCHDLVTSVTAVAEGTNVDSAPVQQSSDHPAPCVTPAEDLTVSQKEESEAGSTRQTRKSRFQKVKPKPNLAQTSRTVHSRPETTKETEEKDCNQTPKPKFHKITTVDAEAEPTGCTSPEKPSLSTGPASDLIPSFDLGCSLAPTEELSTTDGEKAAVGVVGQIESGAATSDQSASEYQKLPEAQSEPSREQAFRDIRPASESTESQVGQGSNMDSTSVQESSVHPALCVTHAEESAVSQKEEIEAASTSQSMRGQLERDNPKPSLPKTSRSVRSKPEATKDPVMHMQLVEKPSRPTSQPHNTIADIEPTCSSTPPGKPGQMKSAASVSVPSLELCSTHKPTEELCSTEGQKTDVGSAPDSEGSEQSVPQTRRRFPKVKPKPNLASSTRTIQTKLRSSDVSKPSELCHMDTSTNVTSEQQPVDNSTEKDNKQLTSAHRSFHTELLSSTKLGPSESEKPLDSTVDEGTSSDGTVIAMSPVAENPTVLTDSVLDSKSSEKPVEGESTADGVEAGPSSQWDCKQDLNIGATETNNQPTDDPTAISGDGSTDSKSTSVLSTTTQSTPDPKESTLQPCSVDDPERQSSATETNQTPAQR